MNTTHKVINSLEFRPAYYGSLATCQRIATALRKHSSCGWSVVGVVEVTIDGVPLPTPATGPVPRLTRDGFVTAASILRSPEAAVKSAWTNEIMCRSVGKRIGRAMARDVIAENMPRAWTGLDPQDADEIPPELAEYRDEIEDWARESYCDVIQQSR